MPGEHTPTHSAVPTLPPPQRAWLREFLAEHDAPCPSCGYNLRGLTINFCPECQQRLALSVRLAEPRLAWFITGLVALAGMVGFNGLIGGYFVWMQVMPGRGFAPAWRDIVPLLVSFIVGGTGLWVWVVTRRRLGRAPASTRWWLAVLAWAMMIISAIWFFGWVR